LSAFDGIPATGDWTLFVEDMANIDTGEITGWSLTLTFPSETCAPDSLIFSDGFESGNITAWNGITP